MKRITYSIFVVAGLALTSCSEKEASHSEEHKGHGHEHHEGNHDDHDHDEKGVIENTGFPVEGYNFYGISEVIPKEAITVEEMVAEINSEGTFEGNVSAILNGVCKKKGCWVTMVNKSGESIRVRFKDHEFGVPTDTPEGTLVVLRGVGTMDTTTIDLQKHYLDDAKEAGEEVSQEQYDAITEDLIEISFISDGILVKK